MPNYKESEIVGSQWTRAFRVVIENHYDKPSSIVFMEEKLLNTGEDIVKLPLDSTLVEYFNPEAKFKLVDPETQEPLGKEVSHIDLYVILNSLYMHLAFNRDNPPIPVDITSDTSVSITNGINLSIDTLNEISNDIIIEEDTNVSTNS